MRKVFFKRNKIRWNSIGTLWFLGIVIFLTCTCLLAQRAMFNQRIRKYAYSTRTARQTHKSPRGYSTINETTRSCHKQSNSGLQLVRVNNTDDRKRKYFHIGFIKTHKTGSSTIQNILFRFGLRNNLSFVLPKYTNYVSRSFTEVPYVLKLKNGSRFDILACHSVFNMKTYRRLLWNDSFFFTVVRHPVERTISAAFYYDKYFHWDVKTHVSNKTVSIQHIYDMSEDQYFTNIKNAVARDIGFRTGLVQSDVNEIDEYLLYVKKHVPLVLLTERFEESMLLLRRYLKWDLEDMIFIPNNVNRWRPSNITLPEKEMEAFRSINFLDYSVYNFFKRHFEAQMEREIKKGITDELIYFKRILFQVTRFCNANKYGYGGPRSNSYGGPRSNKYGGQRSNKYGGPRSNNYGGQRNNKYDVENIYIQIGGSKWNKPFKITKLDCVLMLKGEVSFIRALRQRHRTMF